MAGYNIFIMCVAKKDNLYKEVLSWVYYT